MNVTIIS